MPFFHNTSALGFFGAYVNWLCSDLHTQHLLWDQGKPRKTYGWWIFTYCLVFCSNLKIQMTFYSETSVYFPRRTRHCVPECVNSLWPPFWEQEFCKKLHGSLIMEQLVSSRISVHRLQLTVSSILKVNTVKAMFCLNCSLMELSFSNI
jgi:hypothetical protein